MSDFTDRGAKLNSLRDADASIRPAASGIRCWRLFCGATQRAHFTPTGEGVPAWSSFSAPGRTFAVYVARLQKTCALFSVDFSLRAEAVSIARHRLSRAGDEAFSPRPAISTQQLVQILTRRGLQDHLLNDDRPLRIAGKASS